LTFINYASREINCKIVYYGPGLGGKTTNLQYIYDSTAPQAKGKLISLATETDRTLFFDFLPLDLGTVRGFKTRFHLYTVPGQVFYDASRKLILKGVDGVVFVADSQPAMVDANRESFANLLDNLEENQIDPNDTPIVIQFNKRDIPGVLPVEQLQEALGFEGYPYTEASALRGDGVMETFKLVSKITAKHLFARLKGGRTEAPKKAPASSPKVEVRAPEPEPEPIEETAEAMLDNEPLAEAPNPFADSVPFPDATPMEGDYEKAEEVSLEQLLAEGRTRPETFAGNIAVPLDEVEELGAHELVDAPSAVAVLDEPVAAPVAAEPVIHTDGRTAELEAEVAALQQKLLIKQTALRGILRELDELRSRVSAELQG